MSYSISKTRAILFCRLIARALKATEIPNKNQKRGGIFSETCGAQEQILFLQDFMDEWKADGLEEIAHDTAEISYFVYNI